MGERRSVEWHEGVKIVSARNRFVGSHENAKENYGICVDCFELSKSAELLSSVFV